MNDDNRTLFFVLFELYGWSFLSERDIKDSKLNKRRNQAKQQPNEGDLSRSLKALSNSIQSIKNKSNSDLLLFKMFADPSTGKQFIPFQFKTHENFP
jgi:hypothetical protein